jgi:hypothetical protein
MANSNGILHQLERKADVSTAAPERYTALRAIAEDLSLKNVDRAIVELFAEGVQRATMLAYMQDEDGYYNVDSVTGKVLFPLPWGRAGHRKWSLTRSESEVLREMIQRRQVQTPDRPPGLWLYDRARRCWTINFFDFDTLADGQRYWQRWPLSVQEFRQARSRRSSR